MPDGCRRNEDLVRDLRRRIGEVVTIFTTSGGLSGRGFTGVLIRVSCDDVRLVTEIGPAPGCALGSCCDFEMNSGSRRHCDDEFESGSRRNVSNSRINCEFRNTGAVVVIPVRSIAAVVTNTLGGRF